VDAPRLKQLDFRLADVRSGKGFRHELESTPCGQVLDKADIEQTVVYLRVRREEESPADRKSIVDFDEEETAGVDVG